MTGIKILFDEKIIAERIEQLADNIASKITGDFIIVGLLKGSFIFLADLVRALDKVGLTPQIEFMRLSSYGNNKIGSEKIEISCDSADNISGRQILLLDDIVDTGQSLSYIKNLLQKRGAERILTCVLLNKPSRRIINCVVDFIGFDVENVFVVGYGIDYAEKYRHLPYIGFVE